MTNEAPGSTELSISEAPITYKTLKTLASSPTVPEHYRNNPRDMLSAALQGREIGIGPMTSINNIELIDGSISMRAKLMSALIFGAGHIVKTVTQTRELCELQCYRYHPGLGELIEVGTVTMDLEDIKIAGLAGKGAHKKHPKAMLTNRAMTLAARTFYGDVLAGIGYTPAELDPALSEDDIPVELLKEELDAEVVDATVIADE